MGIVDQAIKARDSYPEYCRKACAEASELIRTELAQYERMGILEIDYRGSLPVVYIIEEWKSRSSYKRKRRCHFEFHGIEGNTSSDHSHTFWMELSSNDGGTSNTFFSLENGLVVIGRCISALL